MSASQGGKAMRHSNGSMAVVVAVVLFVVLAPILYVASIGPVVWLSDRGLINTDEDSVVFLIYSPLQYAADHSRAADVAITWYASLFESPQPPQPVIYGPVTPVTPQAVYYDPSAPPGTLSPPPLAVPRTQ
jgi:hypothetical protein